ncbi:hypothetical protein OPT61_g9599 [Boeremia exigua]|uniref:Uncharacterized protein n=1 Tax=Boeremia exigua TaxID=749465 RepID=A0ACC2HTR4_9PLEO|nr:hypothetical protein OPT61_g9599 [Boeremia exigua]
MSYDGYSRPLRRSPRAAHELQQAFDQLQFENNRTNHAVDDEDEDEDDYSHLEEQIPPLAPRRYLDLCEDRPTKPPPCAPSHVNPLRSHPVAGDRTLAHPTSPPTSTSTPAAPQAEPTPEPRYRFSHPLRETLHVSRQPDPAPRRRPTNLVSYKPANQRLHPRLRRRTSLDTIASVTTTASVPDSEAAETPDAETPSPSTFTLESEYPITPNVDLGPPPTSEPPTATSPPESLRTASIDSTPSMHQTSPVSSVETFPPRGILRKLKPGKRKGSIGTEGGDRLVIERTVSVDQTSYRSTSSSASNTISSGTPTRYPSSDAGNSRSSSTWTASSHDIGGLTPEELKKCRKKGINPALFAEMKAARKGRWTSPIGGNTFLA